MVDLTARVPVTGSLGEVARQLDERLSQRGYDRPLYYQVPGGFAVTTPLERFSDNGYPASEGRFDPGKLGGWNGFWDYVTTFFQGERGRFRVFVFVVANELFTPARFKATQTDIERWGSNGTLNLPSSIARRTAARGTRLTLLIYEFENSQDRAGGVEQSRNRTPSIRHLRWLGF